MSRPLKIAHLGALVLTAAVGAGVGLGLRQRSPVYGSAVSGRDHATKGVVDRSRGEAGAGDPDHSLRALREEMGAEEKEICATLEKLSVRDLRDFYARLMQLALAGNPWASDCLRLAAVELARRDPGAALEFCGSLGGSGKRGDYYLLTAVAMTAPQVMTDWLNSRPEGAGSFSFSYPYYLSFTKGAEAALEMEAFLPKGPGDSKSVMGALALPEGFDYGRFVEASQRGDAVRQVAEAWAARDREAAFRGVSARLTEFPGLLSGLLDGVASVEGEAAAASWLAGKLNGLPVETRKTALAGMLDPVERGYGEFEWSVRLEALRQVLPDEGDRAELAISALSRMRSEKEGAEAFDLVRDLGSEELQGQVALSATLAGMAGVGNGNADQMRRGLEGMMEILKFPAEMRERLRRELEERQPDGP